MSAEGVSCVLHAAGQVGEGATWCARSQRLLWVDVWARQAHRFDPVSGHDEVWTLPEKVGCIAPAADGRLVLGLESGLFCLDPDTGAVVSIAQLDHAGPNRCNDSVVDPLGRLWCGSMHIDGVRGGATGELWSFDDRAPARRHLARLSVPNGLACSPDGASLYLSDSHPAINMVWRCAIEADGSLGERRAFIAGSALGGRPDGATVDADGCYWICATDGWSVVRVTPQGRIDRRIVLPVSKPSKLAIGGARLDTLFITSISATLDAAGRASEALAGGLFAVHVGPIGIAAPALLLPPVQGG